jgi:hypothetical protein
MQQQYPYQPRGATGTTPTAGAVLAVTASVQQITLPKVPQEGGTMRIVIDGTDTIAWSYGASSGLTLTNGIFMLGGSTEVFTIPGGITQLSVIGATTGTNFRVTVGDGQ